MRRRQPVHGHRHRRRPSLRRARRRHRRALHAQPSARAPARAPPPSRPLQRAEGRSGDQETLAGAQARARRRRRDGARMTPESKSQWQIHLCVVLWGFTAILGKLITLPAMALVVQRMAIVAGVLLLVPRVWRGLRAIGGRLFLIYAGIGVLVAAHWLTFYGAIKLANASVAVTCIAVASAFLPFVEPWLAGSRFNPRELLLGVAVVPGVALVVGGVPAGMHVGIVVGIVSAVLVAIFGALNKRYVERADPLTVTVVEQGCGGAVLALASP